MLEAKAVLVPALGTKVDETSVVTSVVLGTADVEGARVDEGTGVLEVVTTTEDVVVGGAGVELVVGGGVVVLVVGGTEVLATTGGSEVRPLTPCFAAQSARFMPLGQQVVSLLLPWVQ